MTTSDTTATAGRVTSEELQTQPRMWETALALSAEQREWLPAAGKPALVIGCGTSYYVGEAYAQLRTRAGLGRTRAAIPSELSYVDDEHILVISRSGTTADVIDVVRRYRDSHRITALLGDVDTPLGRLCERIIDLSFADERSIVQTRFATTGLTVLRDSVGEAPRSLVGDGTRALTAPLPVTGAGLDSLRNIVFLGHSWTVALTYEAALKVREAAGAWTESYPVMEYQHGPISCAGPGTLVWSFAAVPADVAADIEATGALLHITDLDPQASLVAVHRLAVELAIRLGRNPDAPPHLNRSVQAST